MESGSAQGRRENAVVERCGEKVGAKQQDNVQAAERPLGLASPAVESARSRRDVTTSWRSVATAGSKE